MSFILLSVASSDCEYTATNTKLYTTEMVQYTLHYFDCYCRAEPARIMFKLAGVEFTDRRFAFDEWPKIKHDHPFVFGQAPVLEVDGKALPQGNAINRYIGNKLGFAGNSDWEKALVDSFADLHQDYFNEVLPFYCVACKYIEGDQEALKKSAYFPARDRFLGVCSKWITENETNSGFLVGNSITYADLLLFNHVLTFANWVPDLADGFPLVVEHREKLKNMPIIAKHLKERPFSIQ